MQLAHLNSMRIQLLDSQEATWQWLQLCVPSAGKNSANFKTTREQLPTQIYYAALFELPEIVEHYIGQGADVNYTTDWGCGTPLAAASAMGNDQTVSILLANGANPTLAG